VRPGHGAAACFESHVLVVADGVRVAAILCCCMYGRGLFFFEMGDLPQPLHKKMHTAALLPYSSSVLTLLQLKSHVKLV
jgi:hypothetical protein